MRRIVGGGWLILILACVAVFGRVIGNSFVTWDDKQLIYFNPHLNPPNLAGLIFHWTHPHIQLFIPVIYTAWWLLARCQYFLSGASVSSDQTLNPAIFHTANLLVHIASTLTVYAILRLLIRRDGPALIGALLFGLHPIQIEAVAWATGMKDLLSGLLMLLCIWQYLLAAVHQRQRIKGVSPSPLYSGEKAGVRDHWQETHVANGAVADGALWSDPHFACASALFALALLAKPSAVVIPLIVATLDRLGVGRSWRAMVISLAPWIVLSLAAAIATHRFQPAETVDAGPFWVRPLIALDAIGFYLGKLVWPAKLAIDYGRTPARVLQQGYWKYTIVAPFALGLGAAIALFVAVARRPLLTAGVLIFAVALLPVLGFTGFLFQTYSTVADRYVYVAMFGIAIAVAALLAPIMESTAGARTAWRVSIAVLAALAVRSFVQVGVWRDNLTLYSNAVAVNPESQIATQNLAVAYDMSGRTDLALPLYLRCIDLRPGEAEPMDDLAMALPRLTGLGPQWNDRATELHDMLAAYYQAHARPHDAQQQRADAEALRRTAAPQNTEAPKN